MFHLFQKSFTFLFSFSFSAAGNKSVYTSQKNEGNFTVHSIKFNSEIKVSVRRTSGCESVSALVQIKVTTGSKEAEARRAPNRECC